MMKTKKEPDQTTFIQQARQALSQGDENHAREFALLAMADPAQEEQAWLVLASLSEPQQALLYVENALKVNPNSLAARKAIRLVYSQMAAGDEDEEEVQLPSAVVPPIDPLEDTAPIPVVDAALEEIIPEEEIEEIETAEAGVDITAPAPIEPQAKPPATISKETLRDRLRQRSGNTEEAHPSELSPKKGIKFSKKTKPLEEIEEPQDTEAAESADDKQFSTPAVEPEAEMAPRGTVAAPESEEFLTAAPENPPAETPPIALGEAQASMDAKAPSASSLPEQEPAQKAVEELFSGKSNRMVAVAKPDQTPRAETTPAAGKPEVRNNKQEPANVDTIELILVSIAAILLPLLVFLYFYLTK